MNICSILYSLLVKVRQSRHALVTTPNSFYRRRQIVSKVRTKYVLFTSVAVLFLIFSFGRMNSDVTGDEVALQTVVVVQIPRVIGESDKSERGNDENTVSETLPCIPKKNIVYIKAIKCASETMASIFRRFGLDRGLSFVLPPKDKIYLAWPYHLIQGTYRESKTGGFNILCEHAVYDRDVMSKLMPHDTVYLTSMRRPFSQFKSMFHYYNLGEILNMKSWTNRVRLYLSNISMYEAIYKSSKSSPIRYCVPDNFSMSQNLMSFNLGLPPDISRPGNDRSYNARDTEVIADWLKQLEQEFTFVVIVEHFIESLILLKRKLCWTWKDIFHVKLNSGSYSYSNLEDPKLEALYKDWSKVDYLLYDRFNNTLWTQLKQQTRDFFDEVTAFKTALTEGQSFCEKAKQEQLLFVIVPSKYWSPSFNITWSDCHLMKDNLSLLKAITKNYDEIEVAVEQPPVPSNMTKVC